MEEKIIVLSCGAPWEIKNDNGSVGLSGCTVWYYPAADLNKVEDEDGVIGLQPVKQSFPVNFHDRAKEVGLPAVATVHYGMKNSNGKQTLYIKGLDFDPVAKK